ncbi:unnamed protein product [Urochloa decumbens]|uniref:Uncharacterized protein n=1 Tax=Urochloa decumbens TaxID=240449 RepID=A0ABC9APQ5_9POAL
MAAAMLSRQQVRLLAVAALVALMCAAAVAQGPITGSAQCKMVDPNVVNACFKSFGAGKKNAMADRVISSGNTIKVAVDCCVVFGGHQCLCQMKKAWNAQKNGTPNTVQCVKDKKC